MLGGAASSFKFVKEFPDAANGIIDCNHWFNPKDKRARAAQAGRGQGLFFTYEMFNTYTAMPAAGRCDRARQVTDRAAITAALEKSTFSDHFMPYGPTKFVERPEHGGAQPLMTQVLRATSRSSSANTYREAEPVPFFPMKA